MNSSEKGNSLHLEGISSLSQELHQYKKKNQNLKRKIKQKDAKIQHLFGYIDTEKYLPTNPESSIIRSKNNIEKYSKYILTDPRKKQKQNNQAESESEINIFKQPSANIATKSSKPDIRLPILDKKGKSIFAEDSNFQLMDKKSKMIKIPLEKLKPLNSDEVRRRFMLKFKIENCPNL